MKIVHDGFRLFPVGAEDHFVDGVLTVFIVRDDVVAVHFRRLPRIFDGNVRMGAKVSERRFHGGAPRFAAVVQFRVVHQITEGGSATVVFG